MMGIDKEDCSQILKTIAKQKHKQSQTNQHQKPHNKHPITPTEEDVILSKQNLSNTKKSISRQTLKYEDQFVLLEGEE